MSRSGWTVVGVGVGFVIIQSCGGDMGTGRILAPGASPREEPQAGLGNMAPTQHASPPPGYATEDGGWPEFDYDDGGTFWDGGAPIAIEGWHWNQGIASHRGQYGQRFTMRCIPMGSDYAVWGSNPYTDDSPVCTAGAHVGVVGRDTGGEVTIEIRPAQRGFTGSLRNGVTGFAWGPYPGSYRVISQ